MTRVAVVLRRPRTGERRLGDCERAALRAALVLGRALDAEVRAIALGGPREEATLRLALRAGCHRALRIDDRGLRRIDFLAVARALAGAIATGPADLVVCGAESGDGHGGAIGPALGHFLDLPHVADVVDATPVDGGGLEITRHADRELHRYLVPLPAVLCIARFPAAPVQARTARGTGDRRIELAAIEVPRESASLGRSPGTVPTRRTPARAELVTDPAELARRLRRDSAGGDHDGAEPGRRVSR